MSDLLRNTSLYRAPIVRPACSKVVLAAGFAAAASLGSNAWAATYEVGPGKPYANLNAVAPLLAPGDVVEVAGGTTYPGGVVLSRAGTASSKITIRGVRVDGARPVLAGGTNTIEVVGDHYVLEGFDITRGASRCVFHHADDVTVRDTVIHDCPGQGILGADSDSGSLSLEYVEVFACGAGQKQHQIYMATDESAHPGSVFRMEHCYVHDGNGGNNVKSRAERNELYYNWIEGAYYRELELIGPDGQDPSLVREDSDVVGNVLRRTRGNYIARLGGDGTGDTRGRYRFVNNTMIAVEGSSPLFQLFDGIESVEMDNNVLYASATTPIYTDEDASWVAGKPVMIGTNNWASNGTLLPSGWVGTLQGDDPGFVSLAGWDLRPSAKSPLMDHGAPNPQGSVGAETRPVPISVPPRHATEALGTARARSVTGTIDIGAYEHEG
jgi:hypothetical protein